MFLGKYNWLYKLCYLPARNISQQFKMILYIYKRKEEDPCIDRECNALHRLVKKKKAQGRT